MHPARRCSKLLTKQASRIRLRAFWSSASVPPGTQGSNPVCAAEAQQHASYELPELPDEASWTCGPQHEQPSAANHGASHSRAGAASPAQLIRSEGFWIAAASGSPQWLRWASAARAMVIALSLTPGGAAPFEVIGGMQASSRAMASLVAAVTVLNRASKPTTVDAAAARRALHSLASACQTLAIEESGGGVTDSLQSTSQTQSRYSMAGTLESADPLPHETAMAQVTRFLATHMLVTPPPSLQMLADALVIESVCSNFEGPASKLVCPAIPDPELAKTALTRLQSSQMLVSSGLVSTEALMVCEAVLQERAVLGSSDCVTMSSLCVPDATVQALLPQGTILAQAMTSSFAFSAQCRAVGGIGALADELLRRHLPHEPADEESAHVMQAIDEPADEESTHVSQVIDEPADEESAHVMQAIDEPADEASTHVMQAIDEPADEASTHVSQVPSRLPEAADLLLASEVAQHEQQPQQQKQQHEPQPQQQEEEEEEEEEEFVPSKKRIKKARARQMRHHWQRLVQEQEEKQNRRKAKDTAKQAVSSLMTQSHHGKEAVSGWLGKPSIFVSPMPSSSSSSSSAAVAAAAGSLSSPRSLTHGSWFRDTKPDKPSCGVSLWGDINRSTTDDIDARPSLSLSLSLPGIAASTYPQPGTFLALGPAPSLAESKSPAPRHWDTTHHSENILRTRLRDAGHHNSGLQAQGELRGRGRRPLPQRQQSSILDSDSSVSNASLGGSDSLESHHACALARPGTPSNHETLPGNGFVVELWRSPGTENAGTEFLRVDQAAASSTTSSRVVADAARRGPIKRRVMVPSEQGKLDGPEADDRLRA